MPLWGLFSILGRQNKMEFASRETHGNLNWEIKWKLIVEFKAT